jgi:hypothetical protein
LIRQSGQVERDLFGARVDQEQERIVRDGLPARIRLGDRVTVQVDGDGPVRGDPVVIGHRAARRGEPGHVVPSAVKVWLLGSGHGAQETPPPEHRMGAPQRDQLAHEADKFVVLVGPVKPVNLVVLVVGIVVPELGAVHLIPAQQHRDSVGQQQGGQEIALLPTAQPLHRRVLGRSLDAAVPGAVVPESVSVVLAVGLIVLVVIGHQVAQGKAVMGGDEVDRGEWAPAVLPVQVTGARQPGGELGQRGGLPAPEIADPVSVLAVPFGPQRREVPDLVAALTHVPRLGDQLDLGNDRILLNQVEERRQPVHLLQLASEHGRQVEPEAVHVHLGDPVPQRVHYQR